MVPKRYISTPVMVGNLPVGGEWPVRVQSMTNTDTMDTKASLAQCIRIINAGGEMVRLTTQDTREAENLSEIRKGLVRSGYDTPLIADVHFNPKVAERAAGIVEKVRINPGNYVDKRARFKFMELSEKEYSEELERIHQRLLPLIKICERNGTVIRIGINHGSLSDRIMNRYGNTPEGMTASAMEFIRIFRAENFNNLILSMKSSNTVVMVDSTRQLVDAMTAEGLAYPLHLGVTEAGEGEDGRIRSAVGLGALLIEGIGDTIRVSLSEPPEDEIPVALNILEGVSGPARRIKIPSKRLPFHQSKTPYRPEVVTHHNNIFLSENGKPYNGKIHTIKNKSKDDPHQTVDCINGILENNEYHVAGPESLTDMIVHFETNEDKRSEVALLAAALTGRFFILRQSKGICISDQGKLPETTLKEISLSILQATEARISGNRYISCPTCGRTRFDLPKAVKKVKEATKHLTGIKIAIMGCIVNGPGEMAGADYGYIGASEGKIHIFKGTTPVLKNVPESEATQKLLEVIEKDNPTNFGK